MSGRAQKARRKQCGWVLGCPVFSLGSEVCTQNTSIGIKVREILDCQVLYFETAVRDAAGPESRAHHGRLGDRPGWLFALYLGTLTLARIRNDPRLLGNCVSAPSSCSASASRGKCPIHLAICFS